MIVLTCMCVPRPGQADECRAAARELTERSRDHQGLLGYLWNVDESTGNLHLVEVHEGEASVLNHIAQADVSRLVAAGALGDIKLYGDEPSPALLDVLRGFGEYTRYRAV